MRKLLILCFVSLCLIACEREKESPLFAYLQFEEFNWEVESAQGNYTYRLKLRARSTTSTIRRIKITMYDPIHLNGVVLDSILEDPIKDFNTYIPYKTPVFNEHTRVQITLFAYANDGETIQYKIEPLVLASDRPLRPIDNVTLYSALSGRPSYFSLNTMTAIMGDTSMTDLYFRDVAPIDSLDRMSYSWTSPNIYFARFESFNFAEATVQSITNAYKECNRDHVIQNLIADDVLLFGTADIALGTIKIIYIADEAEKANDRYIFSIKAISEK